MFKIQSEANKTVTWPVVIETAVNGGKTKPFEFVGTFRLLSDDEKDAAAASVAAAAEVAADSTPPADEAGAADDTKKSVAALSGEWKEGMIDQIMKIMTGWQGVVGEDDQPLPFTRDNLRAAARGPRGVALLRGINTAIGEISSGARVKN